MRTWRAVRSAAAIATPLLVMLAACTTVLSYRPGEGGADAGPAATEGGGASDGGETRGDASSLCDGALFCEDFNQGAIWQSRWATIELANDAAKFDLVSSSAGGQGLRILASSAPGGYATPNPTFKRRGPNRELSIRFHATLGASRQATLLAIETDTLPGSTIKLYLLGSDLRVDQTLPLQNVIPTTVTEVDFDVAVMDVAGKTQLALSVLGMTGSGAGDLLLGEDVRVKFAQIDLPGASMLAPSDVVFDDIVIR